MIVVRAENYIFILEFRITAFQYADNILRYFALFMEGSHNVR